MEMMSQLSCFSDHSEIVIVDSVSGDMFEVKSIEEQSMKWANDKQTLVVRIEVEGP